MSGSAKAEAFTAVDEGCRQEFLHYIVVFVLGDDYFFPAGVGNGQFFWILPCILESHCNFTGQTEVNARRATAKLQESHKNLMIGLSNEPPKPIADIVNIVSLENNIVDNKLGCNLFVSRSQAPKLCHSNPLLEQI